MYKALVACRAGVGSSLMLKIKVNQVISENNFPIVVEHSSIDGVAGFNGDVIITLTDVAGELEAKGVTKPIISIVNIIDKEEIKTKLEGFLETKK